MTFTCCRLVWCSTSEADSADAVSGGQCKPARFRAGFFVPGINSFGIMLVGSIRDSEAFRVP